MLLEELQLPISVLDKGFKAGIAGAVAGATALVGAMGATVKATFDWADQLDSLQDVMGVTNEEAAALNFVLRKSGVSTDTLSKGMVILNKGLVKADGTLDTVGKSLQTFGINVKDANGKVKNQSDLMSEIAKKYGSFSTQQEKVNFLTETFGRSGAELIDFFDTLAKEGGIEDVTEKVKRLGLVMDPNRYEQFNRNLEEMKLIGLGLAVGFTEKIMPAFEAVSEWVFNKGIPALTEFGSKVGAAFQEGGLIGVADFLLDEFGKIDWGQVSTVMIEGFNSIDWSKAGMDMSHFVKRVATNVSTAFLEFDWLGVGNAIASGLNNFIAGALFGTDEAGLQVIVQTNLEKLKTEFTKWAHGMPSALDGLDAAIAEAMRQALAPSIAVVQLWGGTVYNMVTGWVNRISALANTVLVADIPTFTPYRGNTSILPKKTKGRASGGPVIKGQRYDIWDTFKQEDFIPAVNGRVDPAGQAQPFDYKQLAEAFAEIVVPEITRGIAAAV